MSDPTDYNERLKSIATWEALKTLIQDVEAAGLAFYRKRSGYDVFDFQVEEHNRQRVAYLVSDGISRGNSKLTNLHRTLTIR